MTKDRMDKLRSERKRLRALIHDYCFTEHAGRGCVSCPVNASGACGDAANGGDVGMDKLRKAEETIKKERRKA